MYNLQGILWPPDTFAACPYPMSLEMLYTNKTTTSLVLGLLFQTQNLRLNTPEPRLSYAHVFLHTLVTIRVSGVDVYLHTWQT